MSMQVQPLPGETVYSWVARQHLLSGYQCVSTTYSVIFGAKKIRLHPFLPAHIRAISDISGIDADLVLQSHTQYPLFAEYLVSRRLRLKRAMLMDDGGKAVHAAGLPNFHLHFIQGHRFCPVCLIEDKETFGVSYFHSEHQVPGVSACVKHYVCLDVLESGDYQLDRKLALPPEGARPVDASEIDIHFAEFCAMKDFDICGSREQHKDSYLLRLKQLGYASSQGRLKISRIQWAMSEFYQASNWLGSNECELKMRQFKFIGPMLRKKTHYESHPITHLLLDFWISSQECLGSGVDSPQESRFKAPEREKLAAAYSLGIKLGLSVEYVMTVLGEGESIDYKPAGSLRSVEISPFLSFAIVGMSRQKLAKFFNISVSQVEFMISKIVGLSAWRRRYWVFLKIQHAKYRIFEFVLFNPSSTRTDIKAMLSKEYFQLYRHCPDVLNSILPPPMERHDPHLVWSERDSDVLSILKGIPEKELSELSLSQLDVLVGAHGWLVKKRSYFPRSLSLINEAKS